MWEAFRPGNLPKYGRRTENKRKFDGLTDN